jgi:hypothetical protein
VIDEAKQVGVHGYRSAEEYREGVETFLDKWVIECAARSLAMNWDASSAALGLDPTQAAPNQELWGHGVRRALEVLRADGTIDQARDGMKKHVELVLLTSQFGNANL